MSTTAPYELTDQDVYYLGSISRTVDDLQIRGVGAVVDVVYLDHLREVYARLKATRAASLDGQPSLAVEIISDNLDWLDCFIDMIERR
jgi:hypothetical protein